MDPTAEKIDAVGGLFTKIIESGVGKSAAVGLLSILLYSFFENRTAVLQLILTNTVILYGLGIATVLILVLTIFNILVTRADKAAQETSLLKDKWLNDLKIELSEKAEIKQHIIAIREILEKHND